MKKKDFLQQYAPQAQRAGEQFGINPVVILAQAVLESGWGESLLARQHHNLFGLTAYGKPNAYWRGDIASTSEKNPLKFRKYTDTLSSFMDFARLIHEVYPLAASLSFHPEAYAKEIAYSRYISEHNGDNREAYRRALCRLARQLRITN